MSCRCSHRRCGIDKKPLYYEFANATHNMTEADVFEKFASGS